ncbi:25554_t:CDS:2 [Dentiscutata erythropus]|uniref:25554_t:CDS:1 n=1 Tax=Dentiscutata erythropus TaxID=1348616 RepID=A0A9N9ATN6_9GLOM|nr:25554_t:CDS:2 [Dentiscutata erythropus]
MFILTVLRDTIHIQPYDFHKPKFDALTDEINRIYANKVIQDVGLCICLFEIISASEEIVHYGDGASYAKVTFRLVVFRPFIGEIIEGTVSSNTFEGVKVTLGYFDDILIPTHNDDGWKFDHETQVWVRLWDSQIPEENWTTPEDKYLYMYMDKDTTIRFRVIEEKFTDVGTKGPPPKRTGAVAGQKAPMPSSSSLPSDVMIVGNNRGGNTQNVKTDTTTNAPTGGKLVPYELIGSIAEVGLGLTSWKWG